MDETTEYISKLVKEGFEVLIRRDPRLDAVQFRLRRGDLNCEIIVNWNDLVEFECLPAIPILKRLVKQMKTMEAATDLKQTVLKVDEPLRLPRDNFISYTEGCKK